MKYKVTYMDVDGQRVVGVRAANSGTGLLKAIADDERIRMVIKIEETDDLSQVGDSVEPATYDATGWCSVHSRWDDDYRQTPERRVADRRQTALDTRVTPERRKGAHR